MWAVDYLKSIGYRVDRQGYGTIYFNPKDIEYGLNYSDTLEEQIAIAAIPQVLKRGIVIGEHGNHKLREKATITFGAPVILNGNRVNVAVVVEKRGNRYYTHRVVLPDGKVFRLDGGNKKNVAQEAHRGVLREKSLADATSATSTDSVPDSGRNVNQYSISEPEEGGSYTYSDEELAEIEELRNRASMEADGTEERAARTAVEPESFTGTVKQHYDRTLRQAVNGLARSLNVPGVAKRDFLQPIAQELGKEYMQNGTVSAEIRDRLFDRAWNERRNQESVPSINVPFQFAPPRGGRQHHGILLRP